VERDGSVVIKRGAIELSVGGARAAEVVSVILGVAETGATRAEILEHFVTPDRPVVDDLLGRLEASRLLVPVGEKDVPLPPETNLDVLYWQFGGKHGDAIERLARANLVLVGVNVVTQHLSRCLSSAGLRPPPIVDDPNLRNLSMLSHESAAPREGAAAPVPKVEWVAEAHPLPTCVVAISEFGNQQALREWNRTCVERGYQFFPVLLQNLVGYVGPLVVPGETACYECLHSRWNARLTEDKSRWALDDLGVDAQPVVAAHPAMAAILGNMAALELTKYFGRGLPHPHITTLIELHALVPAVTHRRVLKVPRCPTCSPLRSRVAADVRS
jgi:bacteriocin biosynthesis cyclodehydratase domain-containing protein